MYLQLEKYLITARSVSISQRYYRYFSFSHRFEIYWKISYFDDCLSAGRINNLPTTQSHVRKISSDDTSQRVILPHQRKSTYSRKLCLRCLSRVVVFVLFFILLTDRASTISSNVRGCQSSTWCWTGKYERNIYKAPMRACKQNKKLNKSDEKKGTITKRTCQKILKKDTRWKVFGKGPVASHSIHSPSCIDAPKRIASITLCTLRVIGVSNSTVGVA